MNSRKSLICPWDGLVAGRFPGRDPTPGVVPRLGSKLGLGCVTPPLGSRVLGIPLLGSRLLGIPPLGSPLFGSLLLGNPPLGIPKLGRPPILPVDGNRDGNCPIDGRLRDGMLGIVEGLPIEGIGRLIEGENPLDGAMLREGIGIENPPRLMPPPPRIAPPPPPKPRIL